MFRVINTAYQHYLHHEKSKNGVQNTFVCACVCAGRGEGGSVATARCGLGLNPVHAV